MEPWTIHDALQPGRLQLIAEVIADVRSEIAARFEPEKGDGAWGQGCGAYERTIARIEKLALDHDWLRTEHPNGNLSFTIFIGDVPVKIVPSDEHKPNKRSVRNLLTEVERQRQQLELPGVLTAGMAAGFCWQIGVRTANASGAVAYISIFEANEDGEVRNVWRIPLDEERSASKVARMERKPRRPGRPQSSLKSTSKRRLSDDEKK